MRYDLHSDDCHFVLKLNPRSSMTVEAVRTRLERHQLVGTYEIAEQHYIYDLLAESDVVIVTYSAFGVEAAIHGYPVISLHLPNRVSESALADSEVENVRWVATASEFDEALDWARRFREQPRLRNRALAHRLFGEGAEGATARWARIISGAAAE